jgi:hypothetical protein
LISSKSVSENEFIKSVAIENQSQLQRIESEAFRETNLTFLTIPDSLEILSENSFYWCRSLSLITFESRSKLSRIETGAFFRTALIEIILP